MKTQCRKRNNLIVVINLLKIQFVKKIKENNVKNSGEFLA